MNQARAVLWAQWRSQQNMLRKRGMGWSLAINILWYGAWCGAAFLAQLLMAEPEMERSSAIMPGVFLVMVLYWQVVPLLVAAAGASLDLKKIQGYPISTTQLFGLELLLRTTSAIEMLIILTGIAIGALRNPSLSWWAPLALIPFVILNLLVALGLRDLIVRLMSIRRVREIAAIIFVGLATVPQLLLRRGMDPNVRPPGGRRPPGIFRTLIESNTSDYWPWTATANLIFTPPDAPPVFVSLAILLAWIAGIGALAAWQFGSTLNFDAQAAAAGSGTGTAKRTIMDRIYGIPSALLGDPMGAMVEKELRYLIRSPRFRLVFLMGCTFGLIFSRAFGSSAGETGFLPDRLTYAGIYSLLLLGEVCFWNSFGFDRSAAQIYFLAPIQFAQVLVAKNITAMVFVTLEIALAALLLAVLRAPATASGMLESFAVSGVLALYLLAAGNILSVRNPRSMNPDSSLKTSAAGKSQFLILVMYPVMFLPAVLAYTARWAFETDWAFFGVLAIMGGIGIFFYHYSLESAAGTAVMRREEIVSALSAGVGPIST